MIARWEARFSMRIDNLGQPCFEIQIMSLSTGPIIGYRA